MNKFALLLSLLAVAMAAGGCASPRGMQYAEVETRAEYRSAPRPRCDKGDYIADAKTCLYTETDEGKLEAKGFANMHMENDDVCEGKPSGYKYVRRDQKDKYGKTADLTVRCR